MENANITPLDDEEEHEIEKVLGKRESYQEIWYRVHCSMEGIPRQGQANRYRGAGVTHRVRREGVRREGASKAQGVFYRVLMGLKESEKQVSFATWYPFPTYSVLIINKGLKRFFFLMFTHFVLGQAKIP